jgi:hypothetical protein
MLTETAIRAAKPREKSYKLFDGLGLYLEIAPTGSKQWRLKYRKTAERIASPWAPIPIPH